MSTSRSRRRIRRPRTNIIIGARPAMMAARLDPTAVMRGYGPTMGLRRFAVREPCGCPVCSGRRRSADQRVPHALLNMLRWRRGVRTTVGFFVSTIWACAPGFPKVRLGRCRRPRIRLQRNVITHPRKTSNRAQPDLRLRSEFLRGRGKPPSGLTWRVTSFRLRRRHPAGSCAALDGTVVKSGNASIGMEICMKDSTPKPLGLCGEDE